MAKYNIKIAPTTHIIKWKCPFCGFNNIIQVQGGDRMPAGIHCDHCDFETPINEWTYELDCPLDDLREIVLNDIPIHK